MTYKTHMTEDEMVHLREKLDDLLAMNDGLNNKELNFICSLDEEWEGDYTTGQAKYLESIWSKRFET